MFCNIFGFGNKENNVIDIFDLLLPTLKDDGYMFFYELHQGQNLWNIPQFLNYLKANNHWCQDNGEIELEGTDKTKHHLVFAKKTK